MFACPACELSVSFVSKEGKTLCNRCSAEVEIPSSDPSAPRTRSKCLVTHALAEGHEVFQLPPNAPEEDRRVYSISELNRVYEKYGIDTETHNWRTGYEPASENTRARNGRWTLSPDERRRTDH